MWGDAYGVGTASSCWSWVGGASVDDCHETPLGFLSEPLQNCLKKKKMSFWLNAKLSMELDVSWEIESGLVLLKSLLLVKNSPLSPSKSLEGLESIFKLEWTHILTMQSWRRWTGIKNTSFSCVQGTLLGAEQCGKATFPWFSYISLNFHVVILSSPWSWHFGFCAKTEGIGGREPQFHFGKRLVVVWMGMTPTGWFAWKLCPCLVGTNWEDLGVWPS